MDFPGSSHRPAHFGYPDTMHWQRLPLILLLALLLTLLTQLAGCAGPSYYAQAISGHLGLMRSRVPVSDLLADPDTDQELARRLRQTELMRRFAHEQLGLAANGSYSRLAITGREAVTWNVVAAPEFSLEPRLWCFPVAGCVAYRGYFNQDRAAKFADNMERKSFDVMISPATAYSTLGWFEDPLLDTMLRYSDATLAGIIFHELAHARLYVKSDTAFSEAFAGFVEETGVALWLSQTGQTSNNIDEWKNKKRAAIQFKHLIEKSRQQLEDVYASKQPDEAKRRYKKRIFDVLDTQYRALVKTNWKGIDYFASWMTDDLNNAHLALMESYEGGICAFAALYEEAGQNLEQFYAMADEKAALGKERRQAWLDRPCRRIASAHDL
jgi:predicted aminopeptidase